MRLDQLNEQTVMGGVTWQICFADFANSLHPCLSLCVCVCMFVCVCLCVSFYVNMCCQIAKILKKIRFEYFQLNGISTVLLLLDLDLHFQGQF